MNHHELRPCICGCGALRRAEIRLAASHPSGAWIGLSVQSSTPAIQRGDRKVRDATTSWTEA